MKEVGRRRTEHVKIAPMSAPSPTRERQEHLDSSTAFAEPAQRPHLFQEIAFLTTSRWQARMEKCVDRLPPVGERRTAGCVVGPAASHQGGREDMLWDDRVPCCPRSCSPTSAQTHGEVWKHRQISPAKQEGWFPCWEEGSLRLPPGHPDN